MEDQEIDFTVVTERIKSVMNEHNLSPKSFADKVGENPSKISHLFSGRNNPSLSFVMKICQAFPDVTADWLLGYETEKAASSSNNAANGTIVFPPSDPRVTPNDKPESSSGEAKTKIEDKSNEKVQQDVQTISQGSAKTIKKIIILYSDNSFEEIVK